MTENIPVGVVNPFEQPAKEARARANRLLGYTPHEAALAAAFPLGTGRPGNASSRRTSRQADRRMDASLRRNVLGLRAAAKASALESKASPFALGLSDRNGNPSQEVLAKRAKQKDVVKNADEAIAAYIKAHVKPGGIVYMTCNGNTLSVKRVNAKSITSEAGSIWKYNELTPPHPTEDRAMTIPEMLQVIRDAGVLNKHEG